MRQNAKTADARRWFAEDVRAVAPVTRNSRIIDAFGRVPREHYLGEGPWVIHSRLSVGTTHVSATADPHHLYHDVLVTIDAASGINNGLPSLWALVFDNLNIAPGNTVLQVGAGVGYYTAVLAELVTDKGRVIAYEIESDLASKARANLRHYPQVNVITGDAVQPENLPVLDVVLSCAGVTHVPKSWLVALTTGGRMVLPFTGVNRWGFLLHLLKGAQDLPIKSLGPCGFYHCFGARDAREELALTSALETNQQSLANVGCYNLGSPSKRDAVWMKGKSYWISLRK